MNLTPILRITHRLTAISNPTPLLLKARDSSNMMPAYPIPNNNAIATSCMMKFHQINLRLLLSMLSYVCVLSAQKDDKLSWESQKNDIDSSTKQDKDRPD